MKELVIEVLQALAALFILTLLAGYLHNSYFNLL